MKQAVIVGLSGGIDSFVTASLLQEKGFQVIGVHLGLWQQKENPEVADLCKRLGIEFISWDGSDLFRKQVVNPFVHSYLSGETPNPCTLCNSTVKWNLLLQVADSMGIEKIATGHYIRIVEEEGLFYIHKGKDPVKDQSYFLWGVGQQQLSRTITPLGDYTKQEVKVYAGERGYKFLAEKKESMGVCFLEGKDYRSFIAEYAGRMTEEARGEIVDRAGTLVGHHNGLLNYTVGQRRDIPQRDSESLYVAAIDILHNRIVVDKKEGLYRNEFYIREPHIINIRDLSTTEIEIKIRGLGLNPSGEVTFVPQSDGRILVHLSSPAWAIAPGQPVALYKGERLIGGGIAAC